MSLRNFKEKSVANTSVIIGDYTVPENSTATIKSIVICDLQQTNSNDFNINLVKQDDKQSLLMKGGNLIGGISSLVNLVLTENESLEFITDFGPFSITLSVEEQAV